MARRPSMPNGSGSRHPGYSSQAGGPPGYAGSQGGPLLPGGPPGSGASGSTGLFPPVRPGGYPGGSDPRSYDPGHGRRPPPRRPKRFIDYPRWGRRRWTRWIPSWRIVSAAILTGIVLVIAGFFAAYTATAIPKPNQQALAQTTIVYYAGGKDEIGRLSAQNRQNVDLAQVPLPVRQAVLAAEDHTFYTNSGVDPVSIVRAAWSNVRGNSLQGGSTITQQYVKNVYNERDRSFKRKEKELFLALKINRQVDKDDILARYLNTIYLGRGAYGIQAASQAYFQEDVGKLTVAQGAFLAGIINAPSLADPRDGAAEKVRAERRWNVVLDAMVREKWLDLQTRQTLKFPATKPQPRPSSTQGQTGYLMEMAKAEAAAKLGVPADTLQTLGLKIVTTFNKSLIDAGVKAVKDQLPSKQPKSLRVGMASIDPRTGAVVAIYGGTGVTKQQNQATVDRTQGGSTFKAFGLIAALEDGVSLNSYYSSSTPMEIAGQRVTNFGHESYGTINLLTATKHSVNTVFVQLNHQVGPPKTLAAAIAAGLPKSTPDLKGNLVNVLGSANVHPIDLASAYGTFAAQGVRHDPYVVQTISEIGTGKARWKTPRSKGKRVFDADATADLSYALQGVVQGGTGSYARALDRPVAGKTGTATDSLGASFAGFTPQLVTVVAMHKEVTVKVHGKSKIKIVSLNGLGGVGNVTGGSFPVRIWTQYMRAALDGKPIIDFPKPSHGGEVSNQAPVPTAPARTANPTRSPRPTGSPTPSTPATTLPEPTVTPSRTRTRTPRPSITIRPSPNAQSP